MNAQHKINKLQSRVRRAQRKIEQLNHEKAIEIKRATDGGFEPNLFEILGHINRLSFRLGQIRNSNLS